ncbi:Mlo14p [Orobanche gracilis]
MLAVWMGSKYKAALIPQRIRETIHGWKKAARRRRRLGGFADDSTIHPDSSTMLSVEEYDDEFPPDTPRFTNSSGEIELQKTHNIFVNDHSGVADATLSRVGTPLLRPSASISLPVSFRFLPETVRRSCSLPR